MSFLPASRLVRHCLVFTAVLMQLNTLPADAQVPDNLVVEGVPPFTPELRKEVGRYLEFRVATFNNWHPQRREMLLSTRFADSLQLHLVTTPGGARRQLTFFSDPVAGGSFAIPPVKAEEMYDPDVYGLGVKEELRVEETP